MANPAITEQARDARRRVLGVGRRGRGTRSGWRQGLGGAIVAGLMIAGGAVGPVSAASDLLGAPVLYITEAERTLLHVARDHNLGLLELLAANPGIDPWVPGAGKALMLPTAHLVPDAPREGVVINLGDLRIYYFPKDGAPRSFPIGIGRDGFRTPLGETRVARKDLDPTWYPTENTRADDPGLPAVVPPGPGNPLGRHILYLGWPTYAVHGTNKPWGVGRRVSRGCIRLYPEDIAALHGLVPLGTRVTVVDQYVKLGWHDHALYLEVHPNHAQLDILEASLGFETDGELDVAAQVRAAAGSEARRIDWAVVRATVKQRRGVPVRVTF